MEPILAMAKITGVTYVLNCTIGMGRKALRATGTLNCQIEVKEAEEIIEGETKNLSSSGERRKC